MSIDLTPATIVLAQDHELLYLALLAVTGVKPLSRFERPLTAAQKESLRMFGLLVAETYRPTAWGHVTLHAAFSSDFERLKRYLEEFNNTPVRFDTAGLLHEGKHLGYPTCCVESFVRHPYAPNGLDPHDQSILFHWACPNCPETQRLLPQYRAAWHEVEEIIQGHGRIRKWQTGTLAPAGETH